MAWPTRHGSPRVGAGGILSRHVVILSRQAKDPHRPDREPSAGMPKILRCAQDDKACRDAEDPSLRLGMTKAVGATKILRCARGDQVYWESARARPSNHMWARQLAASRPRKLMAVT